MSMRWTQEQLEEYQAKRARSAGYVPLSAHSEALPLPGVSSTGQEKESALQAKIMRFLTGKGWYFFHDRSRKTNSRGQPDLIVALPGGRVLWIELKSAGGRLRPEQKQVRLMLLALGQEWHEVRSYRQFLEIVGGAKC